MRGSLVVFILIAVVIGVIHVLWHTTTETATVIERFVDGGNIYFTVRFADESTEVFSNNDNFLHGKFNSRDFVSKIKVGEMYRFKLSGYRIPILSVHRNILEVKEVQ